MKKFSLLLLALVMALAASARPVSVDEAASVAQSYWTNVLGQKQISCTLVSNTDFSSLYIFSMNNEGFVIVSSDDRCYPILGYSTNNVAQEMGPETRFWLNQYEQEIQAVKAGEVDVEADLAVHNQSQWQNILQNTWSAPKSATAVSPLMTTQWNQSPYYNYYCPNGTPVGCLATAVAQVMKYWNHPVRGTGSHSYYSNLYGTLSADFGSTTYDWANMPNALRASSSSAQIQAVATLSYHVGVSMNMDYGPDGSGAYVTGGYNTAEYALPTYFGYKPSLECRYKSYYSETNWVEMLKDEIYAGRPVVYAGYDAGGGHAFVFDGYNASNLFHVNWGWGGYYNGYYAMGALNPGGGGTGTNATNTFNSGNHALFGLEPIPTLRANPSSLMLSADAGSTTFSVVSDGETSAQWQATSSASWLSVTPNHGNGMGSVTTVTATVTANTTGHERMAVVTIIEGDDTARVNVTQLTCSSADMCQLTVRMAGTNDNGWNEASLSIESPSGVTYGTAKLEAGIYAEQSFNVCSDSVIFTWHNGSSDGVCSFSVLNANGAVVLNHDRTETIFNLDQWVVESPCAATTDVEPLTYNINAPTADSLKGVVAGAGQYVMGDTCVLLATAMPGYRFQKWSDGVVLNPRSVLVTNNRNLTAYFTTLGVDTIQYENNQISGTFGQGNDFSYAVKLRQVDLIGHRQLTGVKFYAGGVGTYRIEVYSGGEDAPDSVVYRANRNVTRNTASSWNVFSLYTPVTINHRGSLWVVITAVDCADSISYASYGGNPNGSWYTSDGGNTWSNLVQSDQPVYGTWMVRVAMDYDNAEYTLTAGSNRRSWGTVTGGGIYRYGEIATLEATPAEGCYFQRWTDKATENPHPVVVVSDTVVRAIFAEGEPEGIDNAAAAEFATLVQGRTLTVMGAQGMRLGIYDLMGRQVYAAPAYNQQPIALPFAGVYMVRVEGLAARKIVVY